jgi:hypothetical protein
LKDPDKWKNDAWKLELDETGLPVWIIRNGISDEAQNADTNFSSSAEGSNGNGGAAFKVKRRYWVDDSKAEAGQLYFYYTNCTTGTVNTAKQPVSIDGKGPIIVGATEKYVFDEDFVNHHGYKGKVDMVISHERGMLLTAWPVWDAYLNETLDPREGGGVVEWSIDWDKMKDTDDEYFGPDPGVVNSKNLYITRDSGKQRLEFYPTYWTPSWGGVDVVCIITLKARLEQGKSIEEEYTGSICFNLWALTL